MKHRISNEFSRTASKLLQSMKRMSTRRRKERRALPQSSVLPQQFQVPVPRLPDDSRQGNLSPLQKVRKRLRDGQRLSSQKDRKLYELPRRLLPWLRRLTRVVRLESRSESVSVTNVPKDTLVSRVLAVSFTCLSVSVSAPLILSVSRNLD